MLQLEAQLVCISRWICFHFTIFSVKELFNGGISNFGNFMKQFAVRVLLVNLLVDCQLVIKAPNVKKTSE